MMATGFILAGVAFGPMGCAGPVETSIRPGARPAGGPVSIQPTRNAGFDQWISGFTARAQNQGIRGETLSRAFAGVTYDEDAIRRDRSQAEFHKAIWEYLDGAVSTARIANGRDALARHQGTLSAIEARYGVPAEVVTAVWGMESAYGAMRGSSDIVSSLSTLAYDGRRGEFFEAQLIAALKILQSGDVAPRSMTGSWAGAMGHTQFMPTSYLDYAVDFRGDGRRDIWSDDPTDALASTANYLAKHGWNRGQPWAVEVVLPQGFDAALTGKETKRRPSDWARLGVRSVAGGTVPDHGQSSILIPAGINGPALMIFDNFRVIERYNSADAYVIGVGHLSDRIAGAGPIRGAWPRGERPLAFTERKELQERLTLAGFSTGGVDGKIGPDTTAAIRQWQRSVGLAPDGFASAAVLAKLR
ncbi:lytic murein transglycosylase [Roseicyclus sp. F158]|uniref:Lytic murein transglycosylase n=1 Tax=Tropicimonas omnivorans TaxID=3075590 RepID=A0ABU3DE69_9RHOB|nr:lytic murein transglycosylase [Roseicyclus sp. F158]MDT0681432.1 lytic murein transglycosylase [Roseicyclus sp. F158]